VANQVTLGEAIETAMKGGTVVVLGGPRKMATVDLPVTQEYQIRVQEAATYRSEDFDEAIDIIGGRGFDANRFVTATFPLPRAPEAFAAISSGKEVKILVVPDPNGR
jgi:threonine dehydrogenase-like Zn-dependent dehydrogenase